jgi:hypothetical protein
VLNIQSFILMSRGGIVDIATMLRAGRYRVQVPVGAKDFYVPQQSPGLPWGPPWFLFNGYQGAYSEVKRPEREVKPFDPFNHFSPSSAEDTSKWSYTSISLLCLQGLERENFPAAFLRTSLALNNFTDLNYCS